MEGYATSKKPIANRKSFFLYPVENTDWIIAAHANIDKINKHLHDLKINFFLIYLLSSIIIIILSLFLVRFIGNLYERKLELKNQKLSDEILNLTRLNADLSKQQLKVKKDASTLDNSKSNDKKDLVKNRILTYSKNKLKSINVEDISFIYTELSVTIIVTNDGQKYTSNSSLDDIYKGINPKTFFRANRQHIVSIKGIAEILKYGNSQLKLVMDPESQNAIIISKNKDSEFKKWLNS